MCLAFFLRLWNIICFVMLSDVKGLFAVKDLNGKAVHLVTVALSVLLYF